jgi:hypothetical protein
MVRGSTRVVLLCIGLLVVSGCSPGRPADAVALSIYARNLSADAFSFAVHGSHEPMWVGEAGTEEPRTYGCGWVGADWELIVTEGADRPSPADDFVVTATGEAYGDPAVLSLWIDVDRTGTVSIGEGVPDWWRHEIQRCP